MADKKGPWTREEVFEAAKEWFMEQQGHDEEAASLPAGVWTDKYALRDKTGKFWERTPTDMHWRLAQEFARIEAKYPNPLSAEEIFTYLDGFSKIVPQGSPQFGIGNPYQLVSTSNCAVLASPKDNMSGIMNTARDLANLYKRRFGGGLSLSTLRPDGASVSNAAVTSTGAWSFADLYSYITRMVGMAGRRGALMLSMDVRHPDIEKFITMKSDPTKVTGANVSVQVSDEFMEAVARGEDFTLRWPVASPSFEEWTQESGYALNDIAPAKVERTVKAKDIFHLIAEQAANTAEPGLLFWDTIQENLPLSVYREEGFEAASCNPCGEVPLSPVDSCRLVSIYLADFVDNEFTDEAYFDWNDFADTVRVAMRLSDDLVDLEIEKLEAIIEAADTEDEKELFRKFKRSAEIGRRTGLGTHGLADALARMGIGYDSDAAVTLVSEIYSELRHAAYSESVDLGKERGAFPIYDAAREAECEFIRRLAQEEFGLYRDMQIYGRRNGAILTQAPTGSVSIESFNCSSGIEPVFALDYERKRKVNHAQEGVRVDYTDVNGDKWTTYKVYHSNLSRWMRRAYLGEVPCTLKDGVTGIAYSFEEFKEQVKIPEYFVTADKIDWQKRLEIQAACQRNLDHSISSTLNLPRGTTTETVEQIYLEAWRLGLKGVTVYVDGSRDAQVLSVKEDKANAEEDLVERVYEATGREPAQKKQECVTKTKRGITTDGSMTKAAFVNANTGEERNVYVYVGTNGDGRPVEAFAIDEKGHEDFGPYAAAVGRLTSLALKWGIPASEVSRTVRGLSGGSMSYSGGIYTSVPDMVGRLLAKAQKDYEDGGAGNWLTSLPDTTTTAMSSGVASVVQWQASEKRGFMQCPECKSWDVVKQECPTCRNCGWSKCS